MAVLRGASADAAHSGDPARRPGARFRVAVVCAAMLLGTVCLVRTLCSGNGTGPSSSSLDAATLSGAQLNRDGESTQQPPYNAPIATPSPLPPPPLARPPVTIAAPPPSRSDASAFDDVAATTQAPANRAVPSPSPQRPVDPSVPSTAAVTTAATGTSDAEDWCLSADVPPDSGRDTVAIALGHAFLKAARRPGSGVHMGMLVVAVDLQLFRDDAVKIVWPVAQLIILVNTGDARANAYFEALRKDVAGYIADTGATGALQAAAVAKLVVLQPKRNLGISTGWNELLRHSGMHLGRFGRQESFKVRRSASEPAGNADTGEAQEPRPAWVLIMNADISVACDTKRGFFDASNEAANRPVRSREAAVQDAGYVFDQCPRPGLDRPAALPVNDPTAPVALHHLSEFYAFAAFGAALANVGVFDENVWPAYGEDVEMALRLRASGRYTRLFYNACAAKPGGCGIAHTGSPSVRRDRKFGAMLARWGRGEYLMRKWGYDRRVVKSGIDPRFCPFPTPFNLTAELVPPDRLIAAAAPAVSARDAMKTVPLGLASDFVIDEDHRRCVADVGTSDSPGPYYEATAAGHPCRPLCLQRFAALVRAEYRTDAAADAPDAQPTYASAVPPLLATSQCLGTPNH